MVWLEVDAYLASRSWHRRDWLRNHARVGEALSMNVGLDMVTRRGVTWEKLAADSGVGRTTLWQRLRWRREHGLLLTLTTGSTNATRKGNRWGRVDDGLGNLAAEYALIVPIAALEELYGPDWAEDLGVAEADDDEVPWPCETVPQRPTFPQVSADVDETRTPRVSGVDVGEETTPTRAREDNPDSMWPLHARPATKRDRLAAAERLRAEHVLLRGLSARALASIGRPLFAAGGTLADLVHVLNHHPVMGQWACPSTVLGERRSSRDARRLRGLLAARVAAWFDPGGELVAELPSRVLARTREALADDRDWRARLERACAEPDPVPARPAEPAGPGARVRAELERLRARLERLAR